MLKSALIKSTAQSLELIQRISDSMEGKTFHHHFHILYDIPIKENGFYVEIGCYAGASACLMLQKEKINVISIDLGYPISEDVVHRNVKKFNSSTDNTFTYLRGNSQTQETVDRLKSITNLIDILFIDGDHSRQGVFNDFNLYKELVASGGYIVFDDYNDKEFSPEVKSAVDDIVCELNPAEYESIGTIPNLLRARPIIMSEGNCFILRKL